MGEIRMAYIYKKRDPKKKRQAVILFFVLIMAGVIIVSVSAGFFGSDYVVRKSLEDPDVVMHVAVSGGDVIITIYEGRKVEDLRMICLEIEGVSLPSEHSIHPAPLNGAGVVVFSGVCDGVTGTRTVGIRGVFADGSTMILKRLTIKFT